jgi:predicted RNA-binding Zn-ribbon protein involved in translation (DUF1610 family)
MKQYFSVDHPCISIASGYKNRYPTEFKTADAFENEFRDSLRDINFTAKIDGEFVIVYYDGNACYTISKNGRVRSDFPAVNELSEIFRRRGISKFIGAGVLFVRNDDGRNVPYTKAISILRKPKNDLEENAIHLMIFDVLKFNDKSYDTENLVDRSKLATAIIPFGKNIEPITVFVTDDFKSLWNNIISDKSPWEGLVAIRPDNTRVKIKPLMTVDGLVVAVKLSDTDDGSMGSLRLGFMYDDGMVMFDSWVGSGFTESEREEWATWAKVNQISSPTADDSHTLYVHPFSDPRIVTVIAHEVSFSEGPAFIWDDNIEEWVHNDTAPVVSLRNPSFSHVCTDKRPVPEDLHIGKIGTPLLQSSCDDNDVIAIIDNPNTHIISKRYSLLKKLSYHTQCPCVPYKDNCEWAVSIPMGNCHGFYPGVRVISLTKKIPGTIIGFEQVFCPECSSETIPIPSENFPKFSVLFMCPECGYSISRNDVDYRVLWDSPIDDFGLFASEVHPSEIKRAWISTDESSISDMNEIIIPRNEYYPNGLSKKNVQDYYARMKNKFSSHFNTHAMAIVLTDKGPVMSRYISSKKEPIILNEDTFGRMNTGRTVELYSVISDDKVKTACIEIDPREKVPFETTKNITARVYEYLADWDIVNNIEICFNGDSGFYIRINFKDYMDINSIRNLLYNSIHNFIREENVDNMTTGITIHPDDIRADISSIRKTGFVKFPFSLSYKTGLSAIPINIKDINSFDRNMARIS